MWVKHPDQPAPMLVNDATLPYWRALGWAEWEPDDTVGGLGDAELAALVQDDGSATGAALRAAYVAQDEVDAVVAAALAADDAPAQAAAAAVTQALAETTVGAAQDRVVATNPLAYATGTPTRDAYGRVTSWPLAFPDGTPGVFTVDAYDPVWNMMTSWHVDKGSPAVTFTQPGVTVDAAGQVTNIPAIVVTGPYDYTADPATLVRFVGDDLGSDGTAIASWPTRAGTLTAPLVQGTSGSRPLVKAAGPGGRKTAVFDGVDDYLKVDAYATPPAQPVTIISVWKVGGTNQAWIYDGPGGGGVVTGGRLQLQRPTSGGPRAIAGTSIGSASAASTTDYHASVAIYDGSTSRLYVDSATPAATGSLDGTVPFGGITLGRQCVGGGNLTGEVAELTAIGRALTQTEAAAALATVRSYYGLAAA